MRTVKSLMKNFQVNHKDKVHINIQKTPMLKKPSIKMEQCCDNWKIKDKIIRLNFDMNK